MALFDSDFLKQLEYLSLVSRRVFRGSLLGAAADDAVRLGHRVRRSSRVHGRATTCAISTGTSTPATATCCSSDFRKRRTCTSISCSIARGAWAFGDPAKFDLARQVTAALAYIALADLDRIAVIAFADRIVADFPLTRGKARILPLLDFLENLEPQGTRHRPGRSRAGSSSAAGSGLGLAVVVSDLFAPGGLRARARSASPSPLRAARRAASRSARSPARHARRRRAVRHRERQRAAR